MLKEIDCCCLPAIPVSCSDDVAIARYWLKSLVNFCSPAALGEDLVLLDGVVAGFHMVPSLIASFAIRVM